MKSLGSTTLRTVPVLYDFVISASYHVCCIVVVDRRDITGLFADFSDSVSEYMQYPWYPDLQPNLMLNKIEIFCKSCLISSGHRLKKIILLKEVTQYFLSLFFLTEMYILSAHFWKETGWIRFMVYVDGYPARPGTGSSQYPGFP
jgi:hypothetical protein